MKISVVVAVLLWYYFCLPRELFPQPYATVIEDVNGNLLGAKIAVDGQWRFPESDSIPYKFAMSAIHFEDEYFRWHPGFNPVAIGKSLVQNIRNGRIVRGGSTLTQQVIRLSREHQKRTYFEKLIEIILATRLELRYSKDEILTLYASHAPFGGNVVGLDMAAWRYFGLSADQLSWAESATLAVLPNAPSLIFPGKNQERLLVKRNQLLLKLYQKKIIGLETYQLALAEPLPHKPHELPQAAPHLLERINKSNRGERLRTTIITDLQEKTNRIVANYYARYSQSEVYNMAVIIIDTHTGNVLSYVGNTPTDKNHQKDVDIINAPRSTGSILKPLLYATMLDDAELTPQMLVPDIPTTISGYSPKNFNNTYEGATPADMALAKSLNIPFVLLLQRYGVYRFYDVLQQLHFQNINKHPDHYGLSLILGGAESNLWDIAQAYTNLASELNFYNQHQMYRKQSFRPLTIIPKIASTQYETSHENPLLGAGAIWLMLDAMKEVHRPEEDVAWRYYQSSRKVAWKTGTSFGNKDAWSVGITPEYVVGVWVGNATGEGRPSLTGVTYAAPVMFEIMGMLPASSWFKTPYDNLQEVEICSVSGYLAKGECPKKTQWIPHHQQELSACTYHRLVHLDPTHSYQVNADCQPTGQIVSQSWFVLPPVMEWFYKKQHIDYKPIPPYRSDCSPISFDKQLDFIYPKYGSVIYTTKQFGGKLQPFVAKATNASGQLFWYLNDVFLGTTIHFHEMEVYAEKGDNYLTIINESGQELRVKFVVQ
ncbi:MAG: penicillin-binding protein 1C [Capnocytophaga sp.]|nr:penicillin-binding protein 1C [Capnocytophaga sp.]